MVGSDEPWTQLATRIPKALHHRLKVHCITAGTTAMDFVVAALQEKLAQPSHMAAKGSNTTHAPGADGAPSGAVGEAPGATVQPLRQGQPLSFSNEICLRARLEPVGVDLGLRRDPRLVERRDDGPEDIGPDEHRRLFSINHGGREAPGSSDVVAILVRLGTVVVDVVGFVNSVLVVDVDVAMAAVCVTAMIVAEGSTYRRSLAAVAVMSEPTADGGDGGDAHDGVNIIIMRGSS